MDLFKAPFLMYDCKSQYINLSNSNIGLIVNIDKGRAAIFEIKCNNYFD